MKPHREVESPAMLHDPLTDDVAEKVIERFYRPSYARARVTGVRRDRTHVSAPRPKPTHYKVVCISLYTEDIQRLGDLVAELKRRGHTKANKSQVIRAALDQIDLDKIPKGY
jgi:hypothetical protein